MEILVEDGDLVEESSSNPSGSDSRQDFLTGSRFFDLVEESCSSSNPLLKSSSVRDRMSKPVDAGRLELEDVEDMPSSVDWTPRSYQAINPETGKITRGSIGPASDLCVVNVGGERVFAGDKTQAAIVAGSIIANIKARNARTGGCVEDE